MNKKRPSDPLEDWLANNAVVAFVGSLLMATSWNLPEGGTELPLIITTLTIPALPKSLSLVVGIPLFTLSFVLATASIWPPLRSHAIRFTRPFSMGLAVVIWGGFIIGWLEAVAELASDQWWFLFLVYGGYAFFLFIGYRFVRGSLSSPPPTEDGAEDTGSE